RTREVPACPPRRRDAALLPVVVPQDHLTAPAAQARPLPHLAPALPEHPTRHVASPYPNRARRAAPGTRRDPPRAGCRSPDPTATTEGPPPMFPTGIPVHVEKDKTARVKIHDPCGLTCNFCHNEGTPVVVDN